MKDDVYRDESRIEHMQHALARIAKVSSRVNCLSFQEGDDNTETGLYREGPVYLYDMLCEERGTKRENMV